MLPSRDDFRRVARAGLTPVLLVGLVAGCTGSGSTSGGGSVEVRDFSGFTEFSFKREPGLGFCPPLDAVFDTTLALDAEGLYAANISFLTEGLPGSGNCLVSVHGEPVGQAFGVECVVRMQLPEQVLTADQADDLAAVFSEVGIADSEASICQQAAFDPCSINSYTFDSFEVSSYSCTSPRMLPYDAAAIIDLLEELREANPGEATPVPFTIAGQSYMFSFGGLAVFDLTAEGQKVPLGFAAEIFTNTPADSPSEATLFLYPRDVDLTEAEGSQADSITVAVYIAPADSANPCEDGEQVGSFTASYDGSNVSVEVSELLLSGAALGEVSTGRFTLCLVATGHIDATLTIDDMGVRFAASSGG